MYRSVGRKEIIARIDHIRGLLRQAKPNNEAEHLLQKKREHWLKDFVGNARRASMRPMVHTLDEIESLCQLTKDGAYRLFGYTLDSIRDCDQDLNSSRTHLVESYVFDRDRDVALPLELANEAAFAKTAYLNELVVGWQTTIPMWQLGPRPWDDPGSFYVRIGTDDSKNASLPPGAIAAAQRVNEAERMSPNPEAVYVLQFRNGYQCGRCAVLDGRLHFSTGETPLYPGMVRILGRVIGFASGLPVSTSVLQRELRAYEGNGDLVPTWEQSSVGKLFATEHKRFARASAEQVQMQKALDSIFTSELSERTRRRYRSETESKPHVDTLIRMSLENYLPYSEVLRIGGYRFHDEDRYSLESMLRASKFSDLLEARREVVSPRPFEVWDARSKELLNHGALLARTFSEARFLPKRIVRVGDDQRLDNDETELKPGSWLLLEDDAKQAEIGSETQRGGGRRPLYVLTHEFCPHVGHLDHDGDRFMLTGVAGEGKVPLGAAELSQVRRVCGVIVPM